MDLGFVEGSDELLGVEDVGEVDERAGRRRHGDAVVGGGVSGGGAVDLDAGTASVARAVTWVGVGQRGTIRHNAAADP